MKIILVDDHSLFRAGLVHLFASQRDFEVVGEASTIKEALLLIRAKRPDIIMMDVGLPDGSGIDAIPRILQEKEDINIVMLTIHASDESAFASIRLGARGFLAKDISTVALLTALRGLKRGELAVSRAVLCRYVTELLPFSSPRTGNPDAASVALTFREIELLSELSTGGSNSEIAQRLSISEHTVKIHVHNILRKLKLQSRQEAAAYAHRHGLGRDIPLPLSAKESSRDIRLDNFSNVFGVNL
jgi:two-component system nitrate/nitrite response regulator NarL